MDNFTLTIEKPDNFKQLIRLLYKNNYDLKLNYYQQEVILKELETTTDSCFVMKIDGNNVFVIQQKRNLATFK